jgi:hypothetical protein
MSTYTFKEFSGKESPVKSNLPGHACHSGSTSELKNKRPEESTLDLILLFFFKKRERR